MTDVITKYVLTLFGVTVLLAVGMVVGRAAVLKFPRLASQPVRTAVFLIGTGMLLVAAIGRLGWSIQTMDSNSGPENLDAAIFWCLSVLGTVLLVFDFAVGQYSK
jgi:lipid-A-disaccharide synthase-like uncharacterized protein